MPPRRGKGVPWGPKNPLYRYQKGLPPLKKTADKGKANKSKPVHKSTVRRMPKRSKNNKRKKPRRRLSILTGIGMVAGATSTMNDLTPLAQAAYNGATGRMPWRDAGADMMAQTIGIDPRGGVRLKVPTFTVGLLLGAIASKITNKFVPATTFDAIPFIGKRIKL